MPSDNSENSKISLFDFCLFSLLGIGKIPWAPGTMASIFTAIIIGFILPFNFSGIFFSAITILVFLLSYFRLNLKKNNFFVNQDPGWIVIDEFLGMFLGATFLVFFGLLNITNLIILLIFFRVFDITKIYPANIYNEKKGAFPLIADDLISGVYAFFCTILISYIL